MNRVNYSLKQRLAVLRWSLPLIFALLAMSYQLTLARWVHIHYGVDIHFIVEVLFFSTVGPLLAFWALTMVQRWYNEKEQAERQAQASNRRLVSITSASADAILGLDAKGQIEFWNRGAELLFGYTAEEIRNQPFAALFEPGTAASVEITWLNQAVLQDGYVRGHETVCLDREGRSVIVELTATSLSDEPDKSGEMSLILRDVTLRKRREDEIRRLNTNLNQEVAERTHELAEKMDELAQANSELRKLDQMRSEFVSLVSHQIRAPLTNMRGAVERMQCDCQLLTSTCSRMFVILGQQVERLDSLVRDVLNAARIEAGENVVHPEPISLLPVIEQVINQIDSRLTERDFTLLPKPGLPLVYADRDRVAEVIANLLDNADKFSAPGEKVTIEVRADSSQATVSVRDHGPGLPPDQLERVFEKFYRTDGTDAQTTYGYGLGLYVCWLLINSHQGRIWAENHPDGGAVFSFSLPVWHG